MKKNLTEVVFILDRSGSMSGLEKDTIGGFNAMLEKQRREEGEALISTVLFDHERTVIHDRADVRKVSPMTEKEYFVRGCTALLDAVGSAVSHISTVHRYIREEDRPEHTIFVITTDGMENASREYSYDQVKTMITEKQAQGWEFLFLGANIDSAREAARFGIREDRSVDYCCDSEGTALNYDVVSDAVSSVRHCAPISASWSDRIRKDHARRSGSRSR